MPECLNLSDGLSSGHQASYYSDSLLFWSPYIQYFIQPAILCTVYQHVQSYRKLGIWLQQEFSIRHSASTDIQQCSDSNYLAFRTIVFRPPSCYCTQIISNRIPVDQIQSVKQYQCSSCFQTFSKSVGYLMYHPISIVNCDVYIHPLTHFSLLIHFI